jgi:hypothetical protein
MRKILLVIATLAFVATSCSVDLTGGSTSAAGAFSNGGLPNSTAEPGRIRASPWTSSRTPALADPWT